MPKVMNLRASELGVTMVGVYVGRPSKWGNPFVLDNRTTREQVVAAHARWLLDRPDLVTAARKELRGKDLLCFCAPEACHADALLLVANEAHGRCCGDDAHSPALALLVHPVAKRKKLKRIKS